MYVVKSADLSEAIYVGKVNAARSAFTSKEDRTDMVLHEVGMYVRRNFDGAMTATFEKSGFRLEVRVTPLEEAADG